MADATHPAPTGDQLDRQVGRPEKALREEHPLVQQPIIRRGAGRFPLWATMKVAFIIVNPPSPMVKKGGFDIHQLSMFRGMDSIDRQKPLPIIAPGGKRREAFVVPTRAARG